MSGCCWYGRQGAPAHACKLHALCTTGTSTQLDAVCTAIKRHQHMLNSHAGEVRASKHVMCSKYRFKQERRSV